MSRKKSYLVPTGFLPFHTWLILLSLFQNTPTPTTETDAQKEDLCKEEDEEEEEAEEEDEHGEEREEEEDVVCELASSFSALPELPFPTRSRRVMIQAPSLSINVESSSDDDISTTRTQGPNSNNVFCVTLFCMDEAFDSRTPDLFEPLFTAFPECEYCVVTMPHTAPETELLQYFSRIEPNPESTFAHVLFLKHRDSINAKVNVRFASDESDLSGVETLTQDLANATAINELVRVSAEDNTPYVTIVVECEDQVVGVYVIEATNDSKELSATHELSKLTSGASKRSGHSDVIFSVVVPLFDNYARFFYREVMRLTGSHTLHHRVFPTSIAQSVINDFTQVRPRHVPPMEGVRRSAPTSVLQCQEREESGLPALSALVERTGNNYALFSMSKRRLYEPPLHVHSRIVVLGASDAGLAFVEGLLLREDIRFSGITVICQGGLPEGVKINAQGALEVKGSSAENWVPSSLVYDSSTLARTAFDRRIKIIDGTVREFNCTLKEVKMEDGSIVPYDKLVLSPGLQDQTIYDLCRTSDGSVTDVDGAFTTSNGFCASGLSEAVAKRSQSKPIVVYGATLNAVATLANLLREGVPGSQIVWVYPEAPDCTNWCFNDISVQEKALQSLISESGVAWITEMEVVEMTQTRGHVSSLVLKQMGDHEVADHRIESLPDGRFRIGCNIFISCGATDADRPLFRTMTSNGLVYDGRLVVDADFLTARADVYAIGHVAKFTRRISHTSKAKHESYNAKQVGYVAAEKILEGILTPSNEESGGGGQDAAVILEKLASEPVTISAAFPGDRIFFRAHLPHMKKAYVVRTLQTDNDEGYCSIDINAKGQMAAITFAGKSTIPMKQLKMLVGLPYSYAFEIIQHYQDVKIEHLIEYVSFLFLFFIYISNDFLHLFFFVLFCILHLCLCVVHFLVDVI